MSNKIVLQHGADLSSFKLSTDEMPDTALLMESMHRQASMRHQQFQHLLDNTKAFIRSAFRPSKKTFASMADCDAFPEKIGNFREHKNLLFAWQASGRPGVHTVDTLRDGLFEAANDIINSGRSDIKNGHVDTCVVDIRTVENYDDFGGSFSGYSTTRCYINIIIEVQVLYFEEPTRHIISAPQTIKQLGCEAYPSRTLRD